MQPQDFDASYNNGIVKGDTKAIPNAGTGTGVTDTYGADIGPDATNKIGKVSNTRSDSPDAGTHSDKNL